VWINQVESIAVSEIAKKLGLTQGRSGSFGPCFQCGAEQRGSTDKRGPIGLRRDDLGWKCHKCGHGGSGIDLVSYAHCCRSFKEANDHARDQVREWFEEMKSLEPMKPKNDKHPAKKKSQRPPIKEVHALWKKSFRLHEIPKDDVVLEFLKSRNLNLEALARTGVARVTPSRRDYDWPRWWPGGRSMTWRLIVPAFDANGTFCSLHARAVVQTNGAPKTLWPSGFQAGGLFMPNRHAVKMMKGEAEELDGVLFVEGITDFLKVVAEAENDSMRLAVLGGTSGSFSSVGKLNIPDDIDIYVGTDPDQKGDEYANTIQMQLNSRNCYRLPLNGGDGARP